ncbi:MAG: tetratricopeptide repeat protein [Owenweeksia sp.]|nr:tetratricopeptide repeat protein [Owenweeksia sp.]
MMMKAINSLLFILLMATPALAQVLNQPIEKGNRLYDEEKYDEAEIHYRKSMDKNQDHLLTGQFNLGDALYKQERYEEAAEEFEKVAATADEDDLRSKALHNLGNTRLKQKKLKEAVEAYKNSLRLNPGDDETRTNLARALRQLKQQQKQQQNKDQQKKQDPKEGQQQKNQNQEQQNNQNGQQRERPSQDENQEPGKKREAKISRQDAERLLEALSKEEQKVQKKINEKKVKGKPAQTEKDW